jgi:hypothetical protein
MSHVNSTPTLVANWNIRMYCLSDVASSRLIFPKFDHGYFRKTASLSFLKLIPTYDSKGRGRPVSSRWTLFHRHYQYWPPNARIGFVLLIGSLSREKGLAFIVNHLDDTCSSYRLSLNEPKSWVRYFLPDYRGAYGAIISTLFGPFTVFQYRADEER